MGNQRDASRYNWKSGDTIENINSGSFQRIADACETMAKDKDKLERDYKYMRKSRDNYRSWFEAAEHHYRALKGWITRHKKTIQRLEVDLRDAVTLIKDIRETVPLRNDLEERAEDILTDCKIQAKN